MPKLSSYTVSYDQGDYEDKPWQFWTDQQRSLVLNKAYQKMYLTSPQISSYLSSSRVHSITQWLVPAAATALYYGLLRNTLFKPLYRRSPYIGAVSNIFYRVGGVSILGVSTILWLNLSPFYINKQRMQVKTLEILQKKIGSGMTGLNDLVPRLRTSTEIDRRTRQIYQQRNGVGSGTYFCEEDTTPPLLPKTKATKFDKKIRI